jgi:hypothetical protein
MGALTAGCFLTAGFFCGAAAVLAGFCLARGPIVFIIKQL